MTHVLVVDDDAQVRRALTYLLERSGYECSTAATGAEALERAAEARPAVVLLNVTLGSESGLDVQHALDTAPDRPAVIFVTGRRDRFPQMATQLGPADDWVMKPWDTRELLSRVELAIYRRANA